MSQRAGDHEAPLGMIEWDSIAKGIEATDALLKEADVVARCVRTSTPGRHLALFSGEVEAVRAALRKGCEVGGATVIDSLFLPQPHPGLIPAVGARAASQAFAAVGVIETLTICSLLDAADGSAKTGDVRLHEIRLAMGLGGKAFCTLTGEVSQVESALARGTEIARGHGHFLRAVVIPNPDVRTLDFLRDPISPFSDLVL